MRKMIHRRLSFRRLQGGLLIHYSILPEESTWHLVTERTRFKHPGKALRIPPQLFSCVHGKTEWLVEIGSQYFVVEPFDSREALERAAKAWTIMRD